MTTKEKIMEVVQALPDDTSFDDALERLMLLWKIERGLEQADSSETLSHSDVKDRAARWLK